MSDLYILNDNCGDPAQCGVEGLFLPQVLNDRRLDAEFVGTEVDTELDLDLGDVENHPDSDEVYPVILDDVPMTYDGLFDCFGRHYPERAQLLDMLISRERFTIVFTDSSASNRRALDEAIERNRGAYNDQVLLARAMLRGYEPTIPIIDRGVPYDPTSEGTGQDPDEPLGPRLPLVTVLRDQLRRRGSFERWYILDRKIYISGVIDRNVDMTTFFGDDPDAVEAAPTNRQGAEWLNATLGDWMARAGIDGADPAEEFADNTRSRIIFGSLNIVFGVVEIAAGVTVAVGGSLVSMGTGSGLAIAAGGAMTVAGFEALTQGVDMVRTPDTSEHSTGWLGDGVWAVATYYGIADQSDQAAFGRYYAFTMMGLSLGGTGVVTALPRSVRASVNAVGSAQYRFLANGLDQTVSSVRLGAAGIKRARAGLTGWVNYLALPSGRVVFNVDGRFRMVAPNWESLPRLRLRMVTDRQRIFRQERARGLRARLKGLAGLRNGLRSDADARLLIDEAMWILGVPESEAARLVSTVRRQSNPLSNSSFNRQREISLRQNIGISQSTGAYNELAALTEAIHEVTHAMRYRNYVLQNGSDAGYWQRTQNTAYWREEFIVESTALERLRAFVEPRIAREAAYGNAAEATRLQNLLDDAIAESRVIAMTAGRRSGQDQ